MNKRKNCELSPESLENQNKDKISKMDPNTTVANLSVRDLTSLLREINRESLEEVHQKLNTVWNTMNQITEENKELKAKIEMMSQEAERSRRHMLMLEDQVKRKNLIFKGVPTENNLAQAASRVIKDNLKINTPVHVKSTKKIFDRNGSMGIVVELDDEQQVTEILRNTKNLAGTHISVEKDLNQERQENKKAMLKMRKNILGIDNSRRVQVRDDRLKIESTTLSWNRDKELVNGQEKGSVALEKIYGKQKIQNLDLNYYNLLLNRN